MRLKKTEGKLVFWREYRGKLISACTFPVNSERHARAKLNISIADEDPFQKTMDSRGWPMG